MVHITGVYDEPGLNGRVRHWSILISRHFVPGMSLKPFLDVIIYLVSRHLQLCVTRQGVDIKNFKVAPLNPLFKSERNIFTRHKTDGGILMISKSIPNIARCSNTFQTPCIWQAYVDIWFKTIYTVLILHTICGQEVLLRQVGDSHVFRFFRTA